MILQVYEKFELAEQCYRRAAALEPDSFRWRYYLGNVQGWLGKHTEAMEHLGRALKIDTGYDPAWLRLAQLLLEAGRLEDAGKIYRAAVDRNPRSAPAHFGLGRICAARQEWEKASGFYTRAIELAQDYAAAHYALAMVYRRTGRVEKAREHIQRYQSLENASPPLRDPLMEEINALYEGGRALVANGSRLAQEGKLEEAAAAFQAAIEVNPSLVVAHSNLIVMYGELGRVDEAERHYRAAIQITPNWAEAYYNWGTILARQARASEAMAAFEKALQLNRNYADARVQLGILLDDAKRHQEAARQYELALGSDPRHRHAHYLFGRSLAATGRVQEGIVHFQKTFQQNDERTPVYMQALAFVYEHIGDRASALRYAREAQRRAMHFQMADLAAALQKDIERLSVQTAAP